MIRKKWILDNVTHRWCDCTVSPEVIHEMFPNPVRIEPLEIMKCVLSGEEPPSTFETVISAFCYSHGIERRIDLITLNYQFKKKP